jgi:hypothetical protein
VVNYCERSGQFGSFPLSGSCRSDHHCDPILKYPLFLDQVKKIRKVIFLEHQIMCEISGYLGDEYEDNSLL